MKKIKYILILFLVIGSFVSCEKKDSLIDQIKQGTNLVEFENSSNIFTQVSETGDWQVQVFLKVTGPTTGDLSGDITVKIAADTSSDAVEGKHYAFIEKSVVLKESENYLATFSFTMKTDGVEYPSTAHLNLKITSVSGASNIIASGKLNDIALTYVCPYHLGGTYNVHTVRSDGATYDWTEDITELGIGQYLTQFVGTWNPPLNPNYGMLFYNVCDKIDVPQQNLADMYSNQVYGGGTYDEPTGVIDITYTIEFSAGNTQYHSVYTPAKK